ncbi:MAG: hypothetical protein CSA97_01685 [Bacteroidetes bacterium]|nr:MAG: hypothetical protein CSA97_01685 [Bacteroidota bacterium]
MYVDNGQMRFRSRAEKISNPRTEKQQSNRHKLGVASSFLRQMQAMVARGFMGYETSHPGRASRRVGAYHAGLSALLRHGMRRGADGWTIDYPSVQLAEGNSLDGHPIDVKRSGRELRLHFPKGLPEDTRGLRMAIHCPKTNATLHIRYPASPSPSPLKLTLPKWAKGQDLHLYYTVDVAGKSRWASSYAFVSRHDRGRSASHRSPSKLTATGTIPGHQQGKRRSKKWDTDT